MQFYALYLSYNIFLLTVLLSNLREGSSLHTSLPSKKKFGILPLGLGPSTDQFTLVSLTFVCAPLDFN